jgi:hypothetical protein
MRALEPTATVNRGPGRWGPFSGVAAAIVAAVALGITTPASAGAVPVPFDVQVPLVLKALTYDRSLAARAGTQVRIAVVVPAKGGRDAANELATSVASMPDRTVNGMPVTFSEITVADEAALEQALSRGKWAAAYLMPGFTKDEIGGVKRICEKYRVLAVGAQADQVESGLAFGIANQGGKPQLVVNLPTAKACGSDFDLALLRLSRVIQ